MVNKRTQTQKSTYRMTPLYEVLDSAKLIYSDRSQISSYR